MKQLSIYPKEVSVILGKSVITARRLIRTIKDVHKKEKHQAVTIREFCDYMDMPYEDVFNMVNNISVKKDVA